MRCVYIAFDFTFNDEFCILNIAQKMHEIESLNQLTDRQLAAGIISIHFLLYL